MPHRDAGEIPDTLVELAKVQRPIGLEGVLDRHSIRILESLSMNSFENLLNAFEEFIEDTPLFKGDTSFAKAAIALDSTAILFSKLDLDKDHMLSKDDLAEVLKNTESKDREALRWLVDHFDAFTQACFFKGRITKDDLEAARNVFHGLRLLHERFNFNEEATAQSLQHLDKPRIEKYLLKHHNTLEPHDKAGLEQLIDYLEKHSG